MAALNTIGVEAAIFIYSVSCLIVCSSGLWYNSADGYFLNCGSSINASVGNRVFVSEDLYSRYLTTQFNISANISLAVGSRPSVLYSPLLQTVAIFTRVSDFTFPVKNKGRHWVRLHFYPSIYGSYNLSAAQFSILAQNFTLGKVFRPGNSGHVIREFSFTPVSDKIVLSFIPSAKSVAFVNAIEAFPLPDHLIPDVANMTGSSKISYNLRNNALETIKRVNMGNLSVSSENDTLWREWQSDYIYLKAHNKLIFLNEIQAVKSANRSTGITAPLVVYGTGTTTTPVYDDPSVQINITWRFSVDPGFQYFVRLHFCDILKEPKSDVIFNVYVGSLLVYQYFNLDEEAKGRGISLYTDVVTEVINDNLLNVTVGPTYSDTTDSYPILNGLEIMKISNSRGNLEVLDTTSKMMIIMIAIVSSAVVIIVAAAIIFFLIGRTRRRRSQDDGLNVFEGQDTNVPEVTCETELFSTSKFGYRFPLSSIQEATENFTENLIIGIGGFGKVYKGTLKDGTVVAVKRANSRSRGIPEFRTEIEMLSQFRHRHLVSLIGYCDSMNELIIIYEYMGNGTLKEHLYGSSNSPLNWRQRLEICIGAAKALHYLHTGSTKVIIHRDVKSTNILLDEDLTAKVSDLGLSKFGPEKDQSHVSTAVKGSLGYLDPEYLITQQLTEKSDVYSFGVVLLEVLCGRAIFDPSLSKEHVNLVELVLEFQQKGKLEEVVDPLLRDHLHHASLKRFGDISEKCLAKRGVDRPSMGDVLWNLECALQEQGNGLNSQIMPAVSFESSVSSSYNRIGSLGDFADASLSGVFARMAKEDMR